MRLPINVSSHGIVLGAAPAARRTRSVRPAPSASVAVLTAGRQAEPPREIRSPRELALIRGFVANGFHAGNREPLSDAARDAWSEQIHDRFSRAMAPLDPSLSAPPSASR